MFSFSKDVFILIVDISWLDVYTICLDLICMDRFITSASFFSADCSVLCYLILVDLETFFEITFIFFKIPFIYFIHPFLHMFVCMDLIDSCANNLKYNISNKTKARKNLTTIFKRPIEDTENFVKENIYIYIFSRQYLLLFTLS